MIQPTQVKFPTRLLLISLLVYLIAFAFPAYKWTSHDGSITTYGYEVFLMGGTAIIGGGTSEWLTWLANPLFLLCIFQRHRQKDTSVTIGWLATLTALSFIFWKEILALESGSKAPIEYKGLGYFLWVLGITIWTVGISIEDVRQTKASKNEKK